ncbi:MAG: chemotaxis response regulator protein-glutamate methylesterase [Deltaproteobacteria bacterium]|nr:chemotaxis response regulator protein-glutamate methylesterase [Deltaproteobacteria bacterium]
MSKQPQIRVLVVDDSAFLRRHIPLILEKDSALKVVGIAANGQEALKMTKELRPDVITLDVIMLVMDGLAALARIMKEVPTPVLMVSSATREGAQQTIEALALGAVDYITKPSGPVSLDIGLIGKDLIEKVKTVYTAKIKDISRVNAASEKFRRITQEFSQGLPVSSTPDPIPISKKGKIELIGLAASTGGPAALQILLGGLPSLPIGMVIVQHITEGFSQALAERLNSLSPMEIKVAASREPILPGVVLLAPAGRHLKIIRVGGKLYAFLDKEPYDTLHRPSADVLFSSMAEVCGSSSCAVIMTGMGEDGAKGIKEVRDRGGITIAQDEATSLIFGMPKSAIDHGGIEIVTPLDGISKEILKAIQV